MIKTMNLLAICFLLLTMTSALHSEPELPAPILFVEDLFNEKLEGKESIEASNGKRVQIRGFWRGISSEEGVLAATPDLKSCCIKAPEKIHQQVIVRGDLRGISSGAVTLEGFFKIDPQYDQKRNLNQLYVLEFEKEVRQPISSSFIFLIAGMLLILFPFAIKTYLT